jgi:hypothetical protein
MEATIINLSCHRVNIISKKFIIVNVSSSAKKFWKNPCPVMSERECLTRSEHPIPAKYAILDCYRLIGKNKICMK